MNRYEMESHEAIVKIARSLQNIEKLLEELVNFLIKTKEDER